MRRKIGVLSDLQKKYAELLANFNKLLETIKAETIEKLKTQEELRFLQEYSRHIIESAAEGIVTCDRAYRLTSFSPAAEKLLSYRSEEILGSPLDKFFEKSEDLTRLNNLIKENGYAKNFETTLLDKSGETIPVVLSFSRFKGPKEKTMGLVGVIRDLREVKELQTQLIQSGKLAAIGQLAAGVAHEINNPLAIVSGHVQLLLSEVDDPETKSILQSVNSELDRCKDITQGLLSFSGESKTKKFEELNLNKCVENALFLLKHKLALSNIKLIMRLGKNLPKIRGNFSQLQQVFINLFFNAIDAMPKGGNLYLRTSSTNAGFVKITITDTGIGIANEDLPRIFEPFFTTKEPGRGVGLGLSISHGIIKDHGGEIEVQSHKDKTTFTIKLLTSEKRK